MGLSLVVGPAHAGKVELLLDRFVAALERDPWLIVPNRSDVERVERELVERCGGLLAGTIGTFDTLFEALALRRTARGRRVIGDAERALAPAAARRAVVADGRRPVRRATRTRSAARSASSTARLLEPADVGEPLRVARRRLSRRARARSARGTAARFAAARSSG